MEEQQNSEDISVGGDEAGSTHVKKLNEENFLNDQYRLHGRHAYEARRLVQESIDLPNDTTFFPSNIVLAKNAPLVGFLYHRLADVDRTMKKPNTDTVDEFSIMDKQMIDAHQELMYNFRIIMLLDKEHEPDDTERINKGLRHFAEEKADRDRFEAYLRGGIDVLYEKLMGNDAKELDDYMSNLFDFVENFKEKFNDTVDIDKLMEKLR
jgi:hypothetical protein